MRLRSITTTLFTSLLFAVGLFGFGLAANAQEVIRDFNARIDVLDEGLVTVTEEISYDFGSEQRHGIFRDIPVRYEVGGAKRAISLTVDQVLRNNQVEPYQVTQVGRDTNIKIGDPNRTISGVHTYTISYSVIGALTAFDGYDEIYWNVTGYGWPVPINRAKVSMHVPFDVVRILQSACYEGPVGSTTQCPIDNGWPKAMLVTAESSRVLMPGEGMTIAAGFTPDVVPILEVSTVEQTGFLPEQPLSWLVPLLALFGLGLHRSRGREERQQVRKARRATIIPQYEPPTNLSPLMMGAVVDGSADFHDITAGIIWLAEQGYLEITHIPKQSWFGQNDYELRLVRMPAAQAMPFEHELLQKIFTTGSASAGQKILHAIRRSGLDRGVTSLPLLLKSRKAPSPLTPEDAASIEGTTIKLSSLKYSSSYKTFVSGWRQRLRQNVVNQGIIDKGKSGTMGFFLVFGMILIIALIAIMDGFFDSALPGALAGIMIFFYAFTIRPRTAHGYQLRNQILGFKKFLSVTEKERLAFHNAPTVSSDQFMKFLPYAIALQVEKKWAKQFEHVHVEQPSWYHGGTGPFVATAFAKDMSSFAAAANSGFASRSSGSGGGGFSGGGAGGGGGGSW